MTIAALRAGKHVLCEKPLALTPEDCDAMADAATETGKILMHGENMRTSPNAMTAAQLVKSGRVGTVVGVQAAYAHWQDVALNYGWRTEADKSGGGHLIDGAIHYVDVIRHVCGDISHVHAMTATFRPELGATVEDTAVLNFRFAAGHLGQMFACHASRGRGGSCLLTVFGTGGCLTMDAYHGEAPVLIFPQGGDMETFSVSNSWSKSFIEEIKHFLDVIQEGLPLLATAADARENLKIILAAYESARTGARNRGINTREILILKPGDITVKAALQIQQSEFCGVASDSLLLPQRRERAGAIHAAWQGHRGAVSPQDSAIGDAQ